MRLPHSDLKSAVISCSVFILQNNLKETQIEELCAVQKRKAILDCYRHVLQVGEY